MQFLTHSQRYRLWRWTATAAAGFILSGIAYGQVRASADTTTNTVTTTTTSSAISSAPASANVQADQPAATSDSTLVKVTPAVGDQGEPAGLKNNANGQGGITKPNTKYTEIANAQYGEFGTQTATTWGDPNDPTIKRATVSNLNQLPLTFAPGQLIYDPNNDSSPVIDSTKGLSEVQMNFLRELGVNWLNQYRNYVYDHYPELYRYYNQLGGYRTAGMDSIRPFTLLNTDVAASIGDQEARMRANDGMDEVRHDLANPDIWRIIQNTVHADALQQAMLNALVADGDIRSIDDVYLFPDNNENLYIVSGQTLLQYAVDLYNRMQAMLYGELNDPGVTATTQLGHAINALKFADILTGIGFQRSVKHPATYYVTFDSQSFTPYVSAGLTATAKAWYQARGINLTSAYLRDRLNAMITSGRFSQYLGTTMTSAEYNTIVDAQTKGVHTGWDQRDGHWYYYNQYGDIMTGWQLVRGAWYYLDPVSGQMATGLTTIDGQFYGLQPSGQMLTGWQYMNGHWYYFASSGAAASGWQMLRGIWYYFDANNHQMLTGAQSINGSTYGFNNAGQMLTGWQDLAGTWYYFTPSGAALSGWQWLNGHWYYFAPTTGQMLAGLQSIKGHYYYLNEQHDGYYGAMKNGWQVIDGAWYGFGASGSALTGWQFINGRWYRFDQTGRALAGSQTINKHHYYFDPVNAWALTGWQKLNSYWYYFDPANAWALTGWQLINGHWYYFAPDGRADTGWQTINGHRYYFDSTNAWADTGWQEIAGNWYYFDPTNAWALTGWQTLGGHHYYFSADGKMATGQMTIDHVTYHFNDQHDGTYGALLQATSTSTGDDAVSPAARTRSKSTTD